MSAKGYAKFCLMMICILCAFGLMMAGKDGWGWAFLFVGAMIWEEKI